MMIRSGFLRHSMAALTLATFTLTSSAITFGGGDKDASIKVTKGGILKGKSTLAIGAFRVAFITDDAAVSESHGMFANGGSSAKMSGTVSNLEHPLMQKIADEIYADFLKQAAEKGYTVTDSATLATLSSTYAALDQTTNFATSRVGTLVIPTGQRSVAMAADDSARDNKGANSMGSAFHNLGKSVAKADAFKAFPIAAKDANAAVIGVTIVVNFANFKGKSSSFGSSKATMKPGATVDGQNRNEAALQTSLLAWDAGSCEYIGCMAMLVQQGQIHSDEPIVADSSSTKRSDYYFGTSSKTTYITIDPEAYEKNVRAVAAEASNLLLSAAAKEK